MPYGWSSRDRLCPHRMVPILNDIPRFEMDRWMRRRPLRKLLFGTRASLRVADDREQRYMFPGKTGFWPAYRYGKRK
jgi:hypothetical protein